MLYDSKIRQKADQLLEKMTLRQKIGQMIQFNQIHIKRLVNRHSIEELFAVYPFGSVFSGADIIELAGKRIPGLEVIDELQNNSDIKLLVSGDLESSVNGVAFPSQITLGAANDPQLAYEFGAAIAQAGTKQGFNWTFAPVVDVPMHLHEHLGCRALGSDPERVILLASNIIRGMQDNGLNATAKHFPGDGVSLINQHISLGSNILSEKEWREVFGHVYKQLFTTGVRAVMAGHIAMPWKDASGLPATLSGKICNDLLRQDLGFEGVLVSDALIMSGYVAFKDYTKRLITTVNAGIDVLLWPDENAFDILEKAVGYGDIPIERIDEAARRVLEMKAATMDHVPSAECKEIDCSEVARKIAEKGTVLARNRNGVLPLDKDKVKSVLIYISDYSDKVSDDPDDPRWKWIVKGIEERGAKVDIRICRSCLALHNYELNGGRSDAVIVLFTQKPIYDTHIHGIALEGLWMMSYCEKHQPIGVSMLSPHLAAESPVAPGAMIHMGSNCAESQKALVRMLYGEIPFNTENPMQFPFDDSALDAWNNIVIKNNYSADL